MADDDTALTDYRFVAFFVPTPEVVSFPAGTTVTFLDDAGGEPLGVELRVTDEGPVLPQGGEAGWPSVSFRFWQVPGQAHPDPMAVDPVTEAMRAALPGLTLPKPSRIEGWRRRLGLRSPKLPTAPWSEAQTTVIEMVALVQAEESVDWVSVGFDRCLSALDDLVRAFRIQTGARIPHLSYERLPFTVVFAHRALEPGAEWIRSSMLLLRHFNLPSSMAASEALSKADLDETMTLLSFLKREHPFVVFSERAREAVYSLDVAGDYGGAVVNAALGVEVLLDSLISMLCWEEGLRPTEIAATVFSKSLARRVRTDYHGRLGGNWSLAGTGPVADWARVLARLRGRVVHRGYRPARKEAKAGVDVAYRVSEFVKERLADRCKSYPRTTLLLLGRPGLERLGRWHVLSDFVENEADEEPEWLAAFKQWRDELDAAREDQEGWQIG